MGKTFITFYDKTIAENLIEDIEGEEYGNSILGADWAKARIIGRRWTIIVTYINEKIVSSSYLFDILA